MQLFLWPFWWGNPPVLGYIKDHWMPPPGKFFHHIAPATTRVNDFGTEKEVVAMKTALPKLVPKRHNTDPLLCSLKQQAP
jgi:hypothetical protein